MITVHLEEKLRLHVLFYPSVCGARELFCDHVLPFVPLVYTLVSAASISVIDFLLMLTGRGVLKTSGGGEGQRYHRLGPPSPPRDSPLYILSYSTPVASQRRLCCDFIKKATC